MHYQAALTQDLFTLAVLFFKCSLAFPDQIGAGRVNDIKPLDRRATQQNSELHAITVAQRDFHLVYICANRHRCFYHVTQLLMPSRVPDHTLIQYRSLTANDFTDISLAWVDIESDPGDAVALERFNHKGMQTTGACAGIDLGLYL